MQTARRSRSKHVDWALALDRPKLDEPALRVDSIMSRNVVACRAGDSLSVAAQIMWDHDCGCVPVVDQAGRLIGMVTDRDVCMAAYLRGLTLSEIAASTVCSREVQVCHRDELVLDAARTMAQGQMRRLPVVDADGKLVGIFTVSDLVRNLWFARSDSDKRDWVRRMVSLLAAVSRPRLGSSEILVPMTADEREEVAKFDAP